jgi:hypothetical protein
MLLLTIDAHLLQSVPLPAQELLMQTRFAICSNLTFTETLSSGAGAAAGTAAIASSATAATSGPAVAAVTASTAQAAAPFGALSKGQCHTCIAFMQMPTTHECMRSALGHSVNSSCCSPCRSGQSSCTPARRSSRHLQPANLAFPPSNVLRLTTTPVRLMLMYHPVWVYLGCHCIGHVSCHCDQTFRWCLRSSCRHAAEGAC